MEEYHLYVFSFQLHRHNYDTGKALQALVKSPALRSIEKKWTDEDSVSTTKLYWPQQQNNFFKQ